MTFILLFLMFAPDIAALKSEPDLEKRSELALANADRQVDAARDAYQGGDLKRMQAALEEIRDSVNLSAESLEQAHKKARNNKYYKRAELKVRALLRRLSGFHDEVSAEDRKEIEAVRQRLQEVHDQLLAQIMSKK
ncbi:MAG: hypothetical protein ACR2NN_10140 [Bryobacteraceae bacterium]